MSKRKAEEDAPVTPKRPRQTLLSNSLTAVTASLPPSATVSSTVEDRKSKFQGFFIPCETSASLKEYRSLLEHLPSLALADHKIMAWKVGRSSGFEDDGEKWAGQKLLNILTSNEDEGILCVARWYGGILLGPVRFDHIIHVAADALATHHISKGTAVIPRHVNETKDVKTSGGDEEVSRLLRVLKGKDMAIESLRGIIHTKKMERGEDAQMSPRKEKNYERMPLEVLNRLIVGRDATIKSLRDILKELNEGKSG
jgi:Uncharacterized protein family UPF0029